MRRRSLPAGHESFPHQIRGTLRVLLQPCDDDTDPELRVTHQFGSGPGAGRTQFCLRVGVRVTSPCGAAVDVEMPHTEARVRERRQQGFELRRSAIEAATPGLGGQWERTLRDRVDEHRRQHGAVDEATFVQQLRVALCRPREELLVRAGSRLPDPREWQLPVVQALPRISTQSGEHRDVDEWIADFCAQAFFPDDACLLLVEPYGQRTAGRNALRKCQIPVLHGADLGTAPRRVAGRNLPFGVGFAQGARKAPVRCHHVYAAVGG